MKKTLLVLAAVAGITFFAQNAQAELITINIGSFGIGGINGGLNDNSSSFIAHFPISGDDLRLYNNYNGNFTGLLGDHNRLRFAAGNAPATPVNFGPNALIGSGSNYTGDAESLFRFYTVSVPDFRPGSYMGFKTTQNNYGWLEVTWTSSSPASSEQFQILSGAYESRPNVAVLAGGGAAPIPEPGTWAAMAIFAGGAAFAGWRRRNSAKVAA
jgi:hypothetical protein